MDSQAAARLRVEYETEGIDAADLADNPFDQFDTWYAGVLEAGMEEPNTFVLATSSLEGQPSARAVLMKGFSSEGLVLYTNLESPKSRDLSNNPKAAATFVWVPLHRQVRFEGVVEMVDDQTSDEYFATRPRGSQISARVSPQSRVVGSRAELESRFQELDGSLGEVTRPASWGGWRLVPSTVEFWQGRRNRLHDRVRYARLGGGWQTERLAP